MRLQPDMLLLEAWMVSTLPVLAWGALKSLPTAQFSSSRVLKHSPASLLTTAYSCT